LRLDAEEGDEDESEDVEAVRAASFWGAFSVDE
jgi:hypothetical protein